MLFRPTNRGANPENRQNQSSSLPRMDMPSERNMLSSFVSGIDHATPGKLPDAYGGKPSMHEMNHGGE